MPKKLRATHPQTGETFSFTWNREDREPDLVDLESIYEEWKKVNGPHGASGEWEGPSLLKQVAGMVSDQAIGGYLEKARNAVSRAGEFYAGALHPPGVDPNYTMMEQAINKPDSALEPPSQMLADALVPQGTFRGKGAANVGKGLAHGAAAVVGGFADPENLAVTPLLGSLPARVVQIGMALMAAGKANEARQVLQSQGLTGEAADKAMQSLLMLGMAKIAGPKGAKKAQGEIVPESMRQLPPPPPKPPGWNDVVEGEVVKPQPQLPPKPPIVTPPPAPIEKPSQAKRSLEDLVSVVPQTEQGTRVVVPWAKDNEYVNDVMTSAVNDSKAAGGFKPGIQMQPAAAGGEWLYYHRQGEWVPEAAARLVFDEAGNATVADFVGKSKSEGTQALQNLIYPNVAPKEGTLTVAGSRARKNWSDRTFAPEAEKAAPLAPEVAPAPEPGLPPPPRGSRAAGTNPRAQGTNPRATASAEERAAKRIVDRLRRMGKNPNDVLMILLRDYPAIAKDAAVIAAMKAAKGAKNIEEFASMLPPEIIAAISAGGIDIPARHAGDFWKKAFAGVRASEYDSSVPTGDFEKDSTPGPVYSSNLRDAVAGIKNPTLHGPSTVNYLKSRPGVTADEMVESGVEQYLTSTPKTTKVELEGKVEEGTPRLEDTRFRNERFNLTAEEEVQNRHLAERFQEAENAATRARDAHSNSIYEIANYLSIQQGQPRKVLEDVRSVLRNIQPDEGIDSIDAVRQRMMSPGTIRGNRAMRHVDVPSIPAPLIQSFIRTLGERTNAWNAQVDIEHQMAAVRPSERSTMHWEYLKLSGGEKYQENLQKLPVKPRELSRGEQELTAGLTEAQRQFTINEMNPDIYRHDHWRGEDNVLLHERFDTRTDAEGKSGIMLHEMQSDWHQQGQKKGYINAGKSWEAFNPIKGETYGNWATEAEMRAAMANHPDRAWDYVDQRKDGRVPNAPFKRDEQWTALGLKRMVREAAEQGHDRVYWPSTPEQVAKIEGWGEIHEGRGELATPPTSRAIRIPKSSLPASGGEKKRYYIYGDRDVTPIVNRYLELMPRLARDLGKKFGATVGKVVLPADIQRTPAPRGGEYVEHGNTQEVFYLDIPDALRALALTKGLPIYGQPMTVPQKKASARDSERGMVVADMASFLLQGANAAGHKLGKVYRASLAGGVRTAESNVIQALARFGITALSDAVAAAAAVPFSTRLAKSFATRGVDRVRVMLDLPTIVNDIANSGFQAVTGNTLTNKRQAETKALEGLTATFIPGELDERMWHYFGGAINVPNSREKPLSTLDKVTRVEVAPNIIQDRVVRLMVMTHELAPIMRETGSVSYNDLARKALRDPALEERLTDTLHKAMTEALSITAGLPPAHGIKGALKDFTKAVHKFGWSWLVDPFFDYAMHQAPQQFLESAPILNLLSGRTRESLNFPELRQNLKSELTEQAKLNAQYMVLKSRVSHAQGLGRASLKAQQMALEQQMREHNEKKVLPLKAKVTDAKEEGRYSLEQIIEHAMMFAPIAGIYYAYRISKGEDNTEFHQRKDKKTGKLTSSLAVLGPWAIWALLGDMVAREQMKSKFYDGRHKWPFVREFITGMGVSRFPDAPSVWKTLASAQADDTTPEDTRMEIANKWAASVGRAFGKLGLFGNIRDVALENNEGDKVQGNPGVLLPGDKPFTSAGARGFMNEQPEALRHGFKVPPKYDSTTGEKELKEEQFLPFPSSVKLDSKVSEFLRAHQKDLSAKDAYFKATGIEWYDKAATDYLKVAIKNRVEPLIDDPTMDEALKIEAVKTVLARVRDTAHIVARKEGAKNNLPLPPRIARMAAEAEEREKIRKARPDIFRAKKKPAAERLLKPEKKALGEKGKKQLEEPPNKDAERYQMSNSNATPSEDSSDEEAPKPEERFKERSLKGLLGTGFNRDVALKPQTGLDVGVLKTLNPIVEDLKVAVRDAIGGNAEEFNKTYLKGYTKQFTNALALNSPEFLDKDSKNSIYLRRGIGERKEKLVETIIHELIHSSGATHADEERYQKEFRKAVNDPKVKKIAQHYIENLPQEYLDRWGLEGIQYERKRREQTRAKMEKPPNAP